MFVVLIILDYLLWCLLGMARGFIESLIWHCNRLANFALKKDYHPELLAERAVVFFLAMLPVTVVSIQSSTWIVPAYFAAAIFLCYPFFHNGMKYYQRNKLSPEIYKNGWKSEPSSTSIAKMNLSWEQRKLSMITGLVFWALAIYKAW